MCNFIRSISCSLIACVMLSLPLWAQEIPLTSDSLYHDSPQWSPDGDWIVYYKYDATTYWQIYKVPSAGGTEIALTSDSYDHWMPQWSPDGNWIVYHKDDATGWYQIYKTSSVGGTSTALTSDSYDHEWPQWSPDGNWIVYKKYDATGYCQIYKVTSGVGIEEDETDIRKEATSISIYPNPFTTVVSVQLLNAWEGKEANLDIYDASGRLVKSIELTIGHSQLGADLSEGIYFLKIDGKPVGKVVKVK